MLVATHAMNALRGAGMAGGVPIDEFGRDHHSSRFRVGTVHGVGEEVYRRMADTLRFQIYG